MRWFTDSMRQVVCSQKENARRFSGGQCLAVPLMSFEQDCSFVEPLFFSCYNHMLTTPMCLPGLFMFGPCCRSVVVTPAIANRNVRLASWILMLFIGKKSLLSLDPRLGLHRSAYKLFGFQKVRIRFTSLYVPVELDQFAKRRPRLWQGFSSENALRLFRPTWTVFTSQRAN